MAPPVSTSDWRKGDRWRKLEELYSDSKYTDTFRSLYAAQTTYADIVSQLNLGRYGINTRHLAKLASRHPELHGCRKSSHRQRYTKEDIDSFKMAVRSGNYRDKRGRFQAAEYAFDSGLNVRTCEGWYARLSKASEGVQEGRTTQSAEQQIIDLQRSDMTFNLSVCGVEEQKSQSMTLEEMDDLMLPFVGGDIARFGEIECRQEEIATQCNDGSTPYDFKSWPEHATGEQRPDSCCAFRTYVYDLETNSSMIAGYGLTSSTPVDEDDIWGKLERDPTMWERLGNAATSPYL